VESRRFESVPIYDERPPPADDGSRGGMDAFEEESIKSASSLKISFSIRSTFWHRRTLSSVRTMITPRPITKTGAMAHAEKCICHSPARINTTGHFEMGSVTHWSTSCSVILRRLARGFSMPSVRTLPNEQGPGAKPSPGAGGFGLAVCTRSP